MVNLPGLIAEAGRFGKPAKKRVQFYPILAYHTVEIIILLSQTFADLTFVASESHSHRFQLAFQIEFKFSTCSSVSSKRVLHGLARIFPWAQALLKQRHNICNMQNDSKLYHTAMYCSALQYSVVQCREVQFSVVQCSVLLCRVVEYIVVQYRVVQYRVVQCSLTLAVSLGCRVSVSTSTCFLSLMHCTAVHCTALHFTSLHCSSMHYTSLHCTSLHFTSLHFNALHCTALHFTSLHCTTLYFTELHCTAMHYTVLLCPVLQQIVLNCTALYLNALL